MKRKRIRIMPGLFKRLRFLYLSLGSGRECPICGWTGHAFLRIPFPDKPADSFACPSCGSAERHRFAFLTLKDKLAQHADKTLHFAPERCVVPWLRSISKSYLSVDIASPAAMEHMDIINLRLPDASFSLLWCSHVLEHIEDDRKAISELFRVLRPGGLAVIMVPVYGAATYENPEVKTPAGRLEHFKQEDHLRLYGLDFSERLKAGGFGVEVLSVPDLPAQDVERYGLDYPSTREIFLCAKPASR
jgi:SAM-dependent methyltransferase